VGSLVSLGGAVISLGQLGPLQLTGSGIENNIGRTIDYSGLEAGVSGAKRYRRCHRSRAVDDEGLTPAACIDVSRHPLAAIAQGPQSD